MSIHYDGKRLRLRLAAPSGGAPLKLSDGGHPLWEGKIEGELEVEFDLDQWETPEAVRDLLANNLAPLADYSPAAFAPLATGWTGLATLRVDQATGAASWTPGAIVPGQFLPLNVMAGALHYAQSVFEGSKIFFVRRGDQVEARMFRARRNAARMWRSALHLGMPLDETEHSVQASREAFDALYLGLVEDVVKANLADGLFGGAFVPLDTASDGFNWAETPPSVYVRPVLFASGPVLGVKPAYHYTLAVYVTPVGKYRSDLVLRIEREQRRATPGGTGGVKAACNYAPTLPMMKELAENRAAAGPDTEWTTVYDDILFVDPAGKIEEMGGANFFVIRTTEAGLELRTPSSVQEDTASDTILPGVTRDTVLHIGRAMGVQTTVGPIDYEELMALPPEEARSTAVFTTGTAAGIAPVVAFRDGLRVQRFAVWDQVDDPKRNRRLIPDSYEPGSPLAAGRQLRTVLFRLQLGDDRGLLSLLGKGGDELLALAKAEGWLRTFSA